MPLRKFMAKGPGVDTLTRWAALQASGVVTTWDGKILVGYYYTPPDAASATDVERDQHSTGTAAGLVAFDEGWSTWTDVAVVPAAFYPPPDASRFPDPVSVLLDEERRRHFTREGSVFDSERAMVLCYEPPPELIGRLGDLMYRDGEREVLAPLDRAMDHVRHALTVFETQCSHLLQLRRMQSYTFEEGGGGATWLRDELVNYLHYCLTGEAIELNLPMGGCDLSGVIGGVGLWPGETPIVGDEYVASVVIEGPPPARSLPGMLDRLTALGFPYRFTQRAIYGDEQKARGKIESQRKKWDAKKTPLFRTILGMEGGPVNTHAVQMVADAEAALARSDAGLIKHVRYNGTVVLRHRDRRALLEMAKAAAQAVKRCGFAARLETENGTDAFLGTLPGNTASNVVQPLTDTGVLADLLPLTKAWSGSEHFPHPRFPERSPPAMYVRTQGNERVRLNPCVGDVMHMGVFGPVGSAKTTLANLLARQMLRYPGMRVRGIDFKRGMLANCLSARGSYYELGADGGLRLCPFAHLDTEADRSAAQDWAETVFHLQMGRPVAPEHRDDIHHALGHLAGRKARSVTNFLLYAQHPEVRQAFAFYALGQGQGGPLFDGTAEEAEESHFEAYDITHIIKAGDAILLPAVLTLFRRFERAMDGRPMVVPMDEAWIPLGHPVLKPRLRQWLKTVRSFDVGIWLLTQQLSDVVKSGLMDVILESVPTFLFGANPAAQLGGEGDEVGPADFYRQFGLGWPQRETIRTATKMLEFLFTQPGVSRLVAPDIGPAALAFAGATAERDLPEIKRLHAAHGDEWPWRWLERKGVDHARLA